MPLDPEVAALLERQKNLPPRSSLDAAATREMMRRAAALAGPPPALPTPRFACSRTKRDSWIFYVRGLWAMRLRERGRRRGKKEGF